MALADAPPVPARQPDASAVAAAAVGCPAVSRLSAGPFGASAVYLPGKRVLGVEIDGGTVRIHVVGHYGRTVAEIAGQVRDAVRTVAPDALVDVVIEDLDIGEPPKVPSIP